MTGHRLHTDTPRPADTPRPVGALRPAATQDIAHEGSTR